MEFEAPASPQKVSDEEALEDLALEAGMSGFLEFFKQATLWKSQLEYGLVGAVAGKHFELCKFLIKAGVVFNSEALSYVIDELGVRTPDERSEDRREIWAYILNEEAWGGQQDLSEAMETGASIGLSDLCKAVMDICGEDSEDRDTLLYWGLQCAAEKGNVPIMEFLISEGAQVNGRNQGDLTALELVASGNTTLDACKLLLKHGATDLDTALLYAAQTLEQGGEKKVKMCMLLVESGADVNAKDTDDRKALWHAAAYSNGADLCKFLLDRGTSEWQGVLELAARVGRADIVIEIAAHDCAASLARGASIFRELALKAKDQEEENRKLQEEVQQWRAMPNNLKEAIVNFVNASN